MTKEDIYKNLDVAIRKKSYIDNKISQWKETYEGKNNEQVQSNRSSIVWKLAKKHGEILIANLVKPFITGSEMIQTVPKTSNDVFKAKIDEKLLNYYASKEFNFIKFMKELTRVDVKEGTVVLKVSWNQQKIGLRNINAPYADVLYNEDVFPDPNALKPEDMLYIAHRKKITWQQLESNPLYDKSAISKIKNLSQQNGSAEDDTVLLHEQDNIGTYNTETNNPVYIYEFYIKEKGKINIYTLLMEGQETEILQKQEYPFSWFPFIFIQCLDEEFNIWGRSIAEIIEDEQKFMTSIVRGVIDNMALSNNGQKFIRKGALDSVNYNKMLNGEPVVELNTTDNINTAIQDGHFNELPSSVYNMLQVIDAQAEGLTGVTKTLQGLNAEATSAPASNYATMMNQSQIRLLDIEANIANGLKSMFYMWLEMIMKYVSDEEMFEITGTTFAEEKTKAVARFKEQYQVDQLPPDTAQKAMLLIMKEVETMFDKSTIRYDINIRVGTDALKQSKINQINMLMQQAGSLVQAGAVPPDIIQKLMAKQFELFDYPDLAKEIENYKPQPDPMQQQITQIQIAQEAAKAKKEAALGANAEARAEAIKVKTMKDAGSAKADLIKKYADINKTLEETNGTNTNTTNEKTSGK